MPYTINSPALSWTPTPPDLPSLTQAQQALVLSCIKLAYKLAKPYCHVLGDAGSIALWHLCRAAAGYDPARGVKFTTYAYSAIDRSLKREAEIAKRALSAWCHQMTDLELEYCAGRGPAPEERATRNGLVAHLLGYLTPRERAVLEMRVWQEMPLADVARALHVSKSRVLQIQLKAMRKMRAEAEAEAEGCRYVDLAR